MMCLKLKSVKIFWWWFFSWSEFKLWYEVELNPEDIDTFEQSSFKTWKKWKPIMLSISDLASVLIAFWLEVNFEKEVIEIARWSRISRMMLSIHKRFFSYTVVFNVKKKWWFFLKTRKRQDSDLESLKQPNCPCSASSNLYVQKIAIL